MSRLLVIIFASWTISTSIVACAESTPQRRSRTFAALPNWTGLWVADDGVFGKSCLNGRCGGEEALTKVILSAHPPYNVDWEKRYQAALKIASPDIKRCGFPFPMLMESPEIFQFLITPEETALIGTLGDIRHIRTDRQSHPVMEELWPTSWGDSIGRWQGATLIIDTVAVQTSAKPDQFNLMLSDAAHFVERIRMVSKDRLENQLTIEDPVAFTHPWTVTIPYKPVTDLDRIVQGDCSGNDRTPIIDGKMTIAPP